MLILVVSSLFFAVPVLSQSDSLIDKEKIVLDSTKRTNSILVDKLVPQGSDSVSLPKEPSEKTSSNRVPSVMDLFSYSKVLQAVFWFVFGYFLIQIFSKILAILAERSTRYRITIKSFIPVIQILGWIVLITMIITGIFHPPLATVLAFSASIGVAIGFASQDILKNIFGGLTILFDRPFMVGDKIEIGDHYGEVVSIGLRSTRVITADDSLVSVPNSEIVNNSVSNSNSGEPDCQVVAEIYLPIDIDTVKVRKIAMQAAQVSKFVYLKKPVVVLFFNELQMGKSFLKMRLKAYVSDIRNEFAFKSEMTEIVMKELLNRGIMDKDELNKH